MIYAVFQTNLHFQCLIFKDSHTNTLFFFLLFFFHCISKIRYFLLILYPFLLKNHIYIYQHNIYNTIYIFLKYKLTKYKSRFTFGTKLSIKIIKLKYYLLFFNRLSTNFSINSKIDFFIRLKMPDVGGRKMPQPLKFS